MAIEISPLELNARTMISEFRDQFLAQKDPALYSTTQAVLNTWVAMWSSALPVEQVVAIASAMHNMTLAPDNVSTVLTTLTRAKLLRSRVERGIRRYELNFRVEA